MKYSRKTNDNEEVTENMKIRRDINLGWLLSLFVQLYGSIHYWIMDGKNIANATKLVKGLVRCLIVLGTNRRPCQNHIWIEGGEPIHKPTNERKP